MASKPEKRGPRIGDAASLWNFTPSPGWEKDEAQILKLCLMKYGVGQWLAILNTGLLPGKLIQQLNGQTQRLIGQQSLAAYTGLQVDIDRIRQDNEARTDVQRKSGLIIWSGANPTKEMKQQWQAEAKEKYGLTPEQLKEVEEQLEEQASSRSKAGSEAQQQQPRAPVISLLDACPDELTRDQKLQLLKRLHQHLQALVARLGAPATAGTSQEQAATASGAAAAVASARGPCLEVASTSDDDAKENVAISNTAKPTAKGKPTAASKPKAQPKAAGHGKGRKAAALETTQDGGVKKRTSCGRAKAAVVAREQEEMDAGAEFVQADIASLVAMGFTAPKAREALGECGYDVEQAVEWLFANCV